MPSLLSAIALTTRPRGQLLPDPLRIDEAGARERRRCLSAAHKKLEIKGELP